MNIPVEKQIIGVRKALSNRKTPRQFKKGLQKRLRKLKSMTTVRKHKRRLKHA